MVTLPVDNCKRGVHKGDTVTCRGIGDMTITSENAGLKVRADEETNHTGRAIQSIDIDVDKARNGAGISFSTNLCDEAGNTREASPLTVTITVKKNKDGGYDVGYTLTPAWDGTKNK